jgi:hypothetical protein
MKGRTSEVDVGFFDILDHTQFPKGLFQLAALGGALWPVRAAHRNSLHESRPEWRRDAFAGSGRDRRCAGRIGLGIEMVVAEMAAAYEVARWNGMTSAGSTTALDIYAGGRAWWQRADIQIAATGTLNIFDLSVSRSGVLSAEKSESWFDPLVGLRLRFVVSGDVGGFDVGSKFSWQVLGALDYEICRSRYVTWSEMVGYKALSADYSQGSGLSRYEYDLTMHGPIFGVTARF